MFEPSLRELKTSSTPRDAPRDRGKAILYLLNVNAKGATIPDAGMMSYPNFGEPNKVLHHPDMQTLAMMSEEAGADLRILAVQRDARDTLVSTAVHRLGEFPPWPEEAAVLGAQLLRFASSPLLLRLVRLCALRRQSVLRRLESTAISTYTTGYWLLATGYSRLATHC